MPLLKEPKTSSTRPAEGQRRVFLRIIHRKRKPNKTVRAFKKVLSDAGKEMVDAAKEGLTGG